MTGVTRDYNWSFETDERNYARFHNDQTSTDWVSPSIEPNGEIYYLVNDTKIYETDIIIF